MTGGAFGGAAHAARAAARRGRGAAATGILATGSLPAAARRRARPTVAVLGGGVAGMTAAHELAERGFDVTIYERRALGGMARSMPVPGSAAGARAPLPGEHGFRIVACWYHHLPDTMSRIPGTRPGQSVHDSLVDDGNSLCARAGGREDLTVHTLLPFPGMPQPLTPESLLRQMQAGWEFFHGIPPHQFAFLCRQFVMYMTSSEERRYGQWEHTSWWDYLRAGEMSEDYQHFIRTYSRNIQAAHPQEASARTWLTSAEAFVYGEMGRGKYGDGAYAQLLDGPTNEAWIDPWTAHLRSQGVRMKVGHAVEALDLRRGRVAAARVRDARGRRRRIEADWFVCALPPRIARRLFTSAFLAADPRLETLRTLRTDWMNGLQFYLRRETPINRGHVVYADSPWAVSSISQAQFWDRDFARDYGDGQVRECLSTIVADWVTPGIVHGKPARECTPAEIREEVWAQVKAHLEDTGDEVLPDEALHSSFLDPGIGYRPGPRVRVQNSDPLFINTVGSWERRPGVRTGIRNLFLAGEYVQTTSDLATMESANESGRRAANALLDAAGSKAAPAALFERYSAPELDAARRADAERFARGEAHVMDTPWP